MDDKKPEKPNGNSGKEDAGTGEQDAGSGGASAMDGSVPGTDGGASSDLDADTPEPDSGAPMMEDAGPDPEAPPLEDFYDDFNACALDTTNWEFRLPAAAGGARPTLSFTGAGTANAVAEISLPEGVAHDPYTAGLGVPRLMHPFPAGTDAPFQVVAKFDSAMPELIQMQGILLEDGAGRWFRADLSSFAEEDTLLYWGIFNEASQGAVSNLKHLLGPEAPQYLRVARSSGTWVISTSTDGVTWTPQLNLPNEFDVQSVGVFGGNAAKSAAQSPPAHTAKIDAFSLRADAEAPGTGFNREDRDDVTCP